MCGRFGLDLPPKSAMQVFGLEQVADYAPRLNIAPGTDICAILLQNTGGRVPRLLRWGLVPHWAKSPGDSRDPRTGPRMINARAETVAQKPSFRAAFRNRRCLIPATVFYEWRKLERGKQPYAMAMADNAPFAMAGIWARWQDPAAPEGGELHSVCIVTTEANELLRPVHERMPVIVPPREWDVWLGSAPGDPSGLLRPYPAEAMRAWPVGTAVNNPSNQNISLAPVD